MKVGDRVWYLSDCGKRAPNHRYSGRGVVTAVTVAGFTVVEVVLDVGSDSGHRMLVAEDELRPESEFDPLWDALYRMGAVHAHKRLRGDP